MHGRTRLVALVLGLACCLPATAAAAPMPAGTYDVQMQGGTLNLGAGILPPLGLNSGTAFTVPIGTVPIAQPIGLTVESVPISLAGVTGTVDVTIAGAGVTIDPTTGDATVDVSFYADFVLSGTVAGFPVSGSCTIGSQASPVNLHLTTAKGSPWDAVTGAFSMTDNTFALAPSCSSGIDLLLAAVVGSTGSGDNSATLDGIATRQPDPVVPTGSTTTATTVVPTTGAQPAGTTGSPAEVTPLSAPSAKVCIVPKLKGKSLKAAKRAIRKAGCKVGKAKSKKSAKKKGRVLAQGLKAGKRVPAGTVIKLTVSKGKKNAQTHR